MVRRRKLSPLRKNNLIVAQVVIGLISGNVTDFDLALTQNLLGLLVGLPDRFHSWSRPGRKPAGLLGVEDGVALDPGRGQVFVAVNAPSLLVGDGMALSIGDGNAPLVLEGEDPGASLPCGSVLRGPGSGGTSSSVYRSSRGLRPPPLDAGCCRRSRSGPYRRLRGRTRSPGFQGSCQGAVPRLICSMI